MDQATIDSIVERHKTVFPVAVGKIAEELGVNIVSTNELSSDLSGSITKEGDQYVIYVNSSHSPLRQRFTIAHELGHYVKHREHLDDQHEIKNPSKRVLNRASGALAPSSDTVEQKYEIEADQYAAELLMPAKEFTEQWQATGNVESMVQHFNVSPAAINVRAVKLKLGYFE